MVPAARRSRPAAQDLADINSAIHKQYAAMVATTDRNAQRQHFNEMRRLIERRPQSLIREMEKQRGIDYDAGAGPGAGQ